MTLHKIQHYLKIICASLLLSSTYTSAHPPVELKDTSQSIELSSAYKVYEDQTNSLTIEDVAAEDFQKNFVKTVKNRSRIGLSQSTFWIKIAITNKSKNEHWFLYNKNTKLEHIDLYQPDVNSSFRLLKSGSLVALSQRTFSSYRSVFPFDIKQNTSENYFLRISSTLPITLDFTINTESEIAQTEAFHNLLTGIFLGFMAILLFVNALFYFLLRLRSLLFLSFFIGGMLITYGISDGILLGLFTISSIKNATMVSLIASSFAMLGLYYFCEQFLFRDKRTKLQQCIRFSISLYWFFIIVSVVLTHTLLPYYMHFGGIYMLPFIGFLYSGYQWLKGEQHAGLVFIGLGILSGSNLVELTYLTTNYSSDAIWVLDATRFGAMALASFLSIAIVDYVRQLKKSRAVSQQRVIKAERSAKQVFDQAFQMLFIVSKTGTIQSVNQQVSLFFGVDKDKLIDKTFVSIFSSLRNILDQDIAKNNIQHALNGMVKTQTIVTYSNNNTLKDLEVSYQPFIEDKKAIDSVIIQVRDVTKQNQAFKAIQDIVVGIASLPTDNFLKSFLIEISRIYNAKYVVLSRINDTTPRTATSTAIIKNREIIPNITYAIKNTPSERLLNEHLCNFPKNVHQVFPNDEWINSQNIESYLGVNIKDSQDNIIGFLSVMDDKPMHEDSYFIEVLDVFATRISTEIRESEAKKELKEAHEKINFHITNTPLAVIEWDREFNVTKWNKAAERIFGYTLKHFDNKNPIGVLVPKEEIADVQRISECLLNNEGGQYSLNRNLTLDGRIILCEWYNTPLLDSEGNITGVASLVNDVTAEHEALNALYTKENEQREIFNTLLDAIFIINSTGIITTVNNTACKLFMYKANELVGENISILMPEEIAVHHDKYIERFVNSNDLKVSGTGREFEGKKSNGDLFPLSLSIAKLPSDSKGSTRLIGTCHDLTEFKQQQEIIRQSQKMEALGNLTGGIAHDFNNLLGIINGYSELLSARLSEDNALHKYSQHIQKASARGAKLTKKLLSFARKNTFDTEVVDINELLFEEFDVLQKTITPRINLTYSLEEKLPLTHVDKEELEDCILNLSINAMHAIPKHGELLITTKVKKLNEEQARILSVNSGCYVSLSIKDDGIGMNEETKQKALEPFFTTKGNSGTGLGLSQVYGFVERSSGCVTIESELGLGTTIELLLPVSTAINTREKNDVDTSYEPQLSSTILVIDDEPSLVELSYTILSQVGYTVIGCNSAKEGLEIIETESIDAILCDIIMPEMDGIEFAEKLKSDKIEIPILFISGYNDQDTSRASDERMKNAIKKPYNSNELLSRMAELVNSQPTSNINSKGVSV